nr:helix-turn-helix transcriptional regulator [Romboutsia sp. 1001713B170207_170306_H8]
MIKKCITLKRKVIIIQLNQRQLKIIDIVKANEPITSESIAASLNVTRATLRSDLAILTMTGILDARPKVGYFYSGVSDLNLVGNSIKDKKAEDIMSMPVIVKQDISIYEVIVNMFLSDVGSIFITDDNENLCGVVSRKDLLKATIGGSDINRIPIGMIMTRTPNVITTSRDEEILLIVRKIIEHEVDSLPVVETSEDGLKVKIVGRISKTNITKLFLEMIDN